MTDLSKANDTDTIKPDIALAERLFTEFYTRTSDVRGVTRIFSSVGKSDVVVEIMRSIVCTMPP